MRAALDPGLSRMHDDKHIPWLRRAGLLDKQCVNS
jgi:hypothetical protein